jgi:TolA-binding protein
MSDEDLIGLRHDVDRHEDAVNKDTRQIYLLKAEIQELKESIRQLIDAVEDLSIAKQVPIITEIQEKALKRFERLIEGLKQRFKTSE